MLRTFIAVEISEEVRSATRALMERLGRARADVNWVRPDHLHLTLNFLGDVEPNATPAICKSAVEIATQFEPITIRCAGVGAFPKIERPRTLWLGVEEGADRLIALQAELEVAMADLGFQPEARRFQPHLTIGRVRKGGKSLEQLTEKLVDQKDFDTGTSLVRELVVYSSVLTKEGPIYTRLSGAHLGG